MLLNSFGGIFMFILGAGIVVALGGGFMKLLTYVVFDLTTKDGNPWLLLWIIPIMAVLFTCHKLLAYIPKSIGWCFKKSGKLFEKVFDAEEEN